MSSPSNPESKHSSEEIEAKVETAAHQPKVENSFVSVGKEESKKEESDCRKTSIHRTEMGGDSGRERLKRHRVEVAGRVWIPEIWGKEDLLKDWIDCSAFDASLVGNRIMSARAALMEQGRRSNSCTRFRIENSC